MRELSLHILDIAQNSLSAGAKRVFLRICADTAADTLAVVIEDDGRGMDAEFLRRVTDPFSTTRTTRKVGMGLPLYKQAAEDTGGSFSIESEKGKGTAVTAVFKLSSVDRAPLGDIADTLAALTANQSGAEIGLLFTADGKSYGFDTADMKRELGADNLGEEYVTLFLREMFRENVESITGGMSL
jgi:anti-sigma regulatory factor (Ser/Thr protein kinase)